MKFLLFLAALAILTRSGTTLECCLGLSVNSFSTACTINTTCIDGTSCSRYESSGFGLNVVVRGCSEKRYCGNIIKGSDLAREFKKSYIPVLQSIEYPSIEVKCCETDYCNGYGLLKSENFVVFICITLVSIIF